LKKSNILDYSKSAHFRILESHAALFQKAAYESNLTMSDLFMTLVEEIISKSHLGDEIIKSAKERKSQNILEKAYQGSSSALKYKKANESFCEDDSELIYALLEKTIREEEKETK